MGNTVAALVIAYYPCLSSLEARVSALLSNHVDHVYVFDNSGCLQNDLLSFGSFVTILGDGANRGISEAINSCAAIALGTRFDFLWIFDQDSLVDDAKSLEKLLISFWADHSSSGSRTIAVVPSLYDSVSGDYKPHLDVDLRPREICDLSTPFPVGQAITSGMLIYLGFGLSEVLHDEKLFIDWVDLEFCHRARSRGYRIVADPGVILHHSLGDKCVSLFGFKFPLRSPLRHYYMTRNAAYIAFHSPCFNFLGRLKVLLTSLKYSAVVLFAPRRANLKAYLIGYCHGILKSMGKAKLRF